jgi:Ca2+-binding EF-hand superfamily protein
MTKAPWIAGAALAATLAVAGYAQPAPDGPPKTRADLQARIADHFKKADANGDGYVTKAEFDAARQAMRAKFAERRAEHREKRFAMLDSNKDGQLSKQEFTAPPPRHDEANGSDENARRGKWRGHHHGMRHGHGMMAGARGQAWFDRADADHDGKVSLAEASARPLAIFDKVDSNHDGTISSEEHDAARDAMRAKWRERRDAKGGNAS